jgi:hypothetical protein
MLSFHAISFLILSSGQSLNELFTSATKINAHF